MAKLVKGLNDLKTKFPQIAAQAEGGTLLTSFMEAAKNSWKCKLGINGKQP